MPNWLNWIINLGIIPAGWATKLGGWLGIITAIACMLGHPIKFLPCAPAIAPALLSMGVMGVGIGRRVPTKSGGVTYAAGVKATYTQGS